MYHVTPSTLPLALSLRRGSPKPKGISIGVDVARHSRREDDADAESASMATSPFVRSVHPASVN